MSQELQTSRLEILTSRLGW